MRKQIFTAALVVGCVTSVTAVAADVEEKTTVGGRAFIDLTNIDQEVNGAKTVPSGTGLDVKRFYIAVDHIFDSTWSANVTTDFNYIAADSETQVFIKKAYVQAKISDALVVHAGSYDVPWIPFVEGLYGYRWVENVLVEHLKMQSSADWGVNASGSFADGMVNYSASVIGGSGYKKMVRSKGMDVEGRVSFVPITGLTFAVGGYNGKLGQETQITDALHTAQRWDLLAAYVNSKVRVGAEYFQSKNWNGTANEVLTNTTDKADGYSAWASFNFTDALAVFARYDNAKLSKDLNPDLENKYFNVGLAFKPRKNVDLALVYKNDKVDNGPYATSNATFAADTITGKFSEIGVWAQVSY